MGYFRERVKQQKCSLRCYFGNTFLIKIIVTNKYVTYELLAYRQYANVASCVVKLKPTECTR